MEIAFVKTIFVIIPLSFNIDITSLNLRIENTETISFMSFRI